MPEPRTGAPEGGTIGVVGIYDDPDALLVAARQVREAGFRCWDCHTPYPVHGLDRAMGLGPSPVPYVTLSAGFVGLVCAYVLTGALSAWHYPIRIGGKALLSWQAFVPIYFEMFVLFAAVATLGAVIVFCRLGRWHSPLFDSGVMAEVTGRRYAIVIETGDEAEALAGARAVIEATGCAELRPLRIEEEA